MMTNPLCKYHFNIINFFFRHTMTHIFIFICSLGNSFSSEQYVCECKILYLFPKLSFIFDNNTMVSFSSEDIFENDGNKC